ncbi:hypothetical protein D6856_13230 [Butyrivibrio sp. XB500-5]|uniref:hypothetical protein n=1 Tax=Butyrivibrio sp. XB500-5 TaxID=2364880 RepID=UPI000EA8CAA0|nr:hypothetical protein [Butyrivibrio sp. XB500-5]RKM58705.1 hypothetical protein D6856_13230 [Butyrivibrio sp. XB500-5]
MIYRIDVNKGKFYDAKLTRNFCERMLTAAQDYCRKSSDTDDAYKDFAANEGFQGLAADNTKNFVLNGMGTMNRDIADEHRKMVEDQESLIECFEKTVDSDPNAIIDYDALDKINTDLTGYHSSFGSIAGRVEAIINALDMLVGPDYGTFPRPDRGTVDNKFTALCGGDGDGGYIRECQNKLIKFDEDMTAYLGQNDTETFLGDVTSKTSRSAGVFAEYGDAPMPILKTPQNFKVVKDVTNNNNAQGAAGLTGFSSPALEAAQKQAMDKNSPFYDIKHFGGNHEDNGSGWKGFCIDENPATIYLSLAFEGYRLVANDQDKELYKYLKPKRNNWNEYAEQGGYEIRNSFLYDDTDLGIYYLLNRINTSDTAASNIMFEQLKYLDDISFEKQMGFSRRGKNGDLNYRFFNADFRNETEESIALYDTGALDAMIQKRALEYKGNENLFKKNYGGVRLLNSDGSYNLYALELIRKEVIEEKRSEIFYMQPEYNMDGKLINTLEEGRGSKDAKGTLSLINKLSFYCDKHGFDMTARSLNKGVIAPDNNEINNALTNGESVTFSAKNFELTDETTKRSFTVDGEEQLVVAGVKDDKLVVSYKGQKWLYDPKSGANTNAANDFYAVKVSRKAEGNITPKGANPFYDNTIWEDYKIEKRNVDGMELNKYHFTKIENLAAFAANQKLPGFEKSTVGDEEIERVKNAITAMGNAGSYDVNRAMILERAYKDKPEEFKKKYGFDLYDAQGNLNVEYIMLDYYQKSGHKMLIDCRTKEGEEIYVNWLKNYYKDNSRVYKDVYGKNLCDVPDAELDANCRKNYENAKVENLKKGLHVIELPEAQRRHYTETVENENIKFEQYCKAHGDNLKIKDMSGLSTQDRLKKVKKSDFNARREAMMHDNIPTSDEIKKAKDAGYDMYFECSDPYYLEDEKGNTGVIGLGELRSKEMEILDVKNIKGTDGVEREKYVVSCNGKQYYYDPIAHGKDCSNFYAMKVETKK